VYLTRHYQDMQPEIRKMQPVSYHSSCLFATVVFHAFYRQTWSYHHVFTVISLTSVALQITHNRVLKIADRIVNNFSFLIMLADIPRALDLKLPFLLWCPLAVVCIDFTNFWLPGRRRWRYIHRVWVLVFSAHVFLSLLH
jgi:hypothetical protein